MSDIKLSNSARIGKNTADRGPVHLLVEIHVLEAQLEQFLIEFHALSDPLKVDQILKGHLEQADSLNQRLSLEPFAQDGGCLTSELALLES